MANMSFAGDWKITAYCSCVKCCGKSDGIMANGKKVHPGAIACNILPLGTKVAIPGVSKTEIFTVEDRGSHKLFDNQKHIDIYKPSHKEALEFGVQKSPVYKITEI
jgi:3D (Asp-Asp-Asp) domain-containing protein